jgi:hypothetical protein
MTINKKKLKRNFIAVIIVLLGTILQYSGLGNKLYNKNVKNNKNLISAALADSVSPPECVTECSECTGETNCGH